MNEMTESGVFVDIDTDYKESVKEIQIFPNRDQAKRHGVSVQEIGTTINALIGGVVVGKYSKDGHRNDIRIKRPMLLEIDWMILRKSLLEIQEEN